MECQHCDHCYDFLCRCNKDQGTNNDVLNGDHEYTQGHLDRSSFQSNPGSTYMIYVSLCGSTAKKERSQLALVIVICAKYLQSQ
ncbi:hypothetical protein TNCV_4877681 [Trichonephila clavipes]|nr:hypothetical protein TNCV_4877681 [Trichonephila clavipes]